MLINKTVIFIAEYNRFRHLENIYFVINII